MKSEMKCLPAPYGHDTGDYISMRTDKPVSDDLEDILLAFSCYPPTLPRIRASLSHSGRYDCVVQPGWFRHHFGTLRYYLNGIGIDLIVTTLYQGETKELNCDYDEEYMDWYTSVVKG